MKDRPKAIARPPELAGPGFEPVQLLHEEREQRCLEFILESTARYGRELFLGPWLRRLNDVFPELADYERKALLNSLEMAGVVRVEHRPAQGGNHAYAVLVVNYNHPDVRARN